MTERFEANDYYHFILDNETNHEISVTEATELLNRLYRENQGLNEFSNKVFKLINDSIKIYENTTTNDEFLQIQLDTKLQTLYNLQKKLQKNVRC